MSKNSEEKKSNNPLKKVKTGQPQTSVKMNFVKRSSLPSNLTEVQTVNKNKKK